MEITMTIQNIKLGLSLCLLPIFICSCGSRQAGTTAQQGDASAQPGSAQAAVGGDSAVPDGAPEWARGNCNAFFKSRGNLICGVGIVTNIKNPNLARTAAQGRGRTEIARILDLRVEAVLKDYQSTTAGTTTTTGKDGETVDFDDNRQVIEDVSKQITEVSLPDTYMAENWTGPDGSFYALMVLEMGAFQSSVQGTTEIAVEYRNAIVERAGKLFSDLDDEAGWN